MAAMLATQTPFSAESLTLSTADRTSWGAHRALRSELADAERIHRLIGTDTPVAYEPTLERAILPQVDDIAAAILDLATY